MDKLLKFNLQYFAEPPADPPVPPADPPLPPADPPADPPVAPADPPKTYTPAELEAIKAAAAADAIKAAEVAAAAAKAKEEELSKLSATQRAQKEAEDAKAELAKVLAEQAADKAAADAAKELTTRGLPIEFAKLVVGETNAETLEAIVAVETQFKAAVEAAVNARFAAGAQAPPALDPATGKPDDWAAADAAMLARYQ